MNAHILIFGFVQGVGYRQFVKRKARSFGLTGFVRNLPDNRVEAQFNGDKEKIMKMIEICKKGPFLSEVKHVDIKWENGINDYKDFVILR